MKRKIISFLLAACMACALIVSPASALDGGEAVQTVNALGIMSGDADLSAQVTRAQFAKMLAAASSYRDSIQEEGGGYSLFRDVKSSHWASEYIRLAVQEGWMTGYTDGTFRPDQTVKLEEACAAVLKLLGYDSASLAGSFPSAQLRKAGALGLREQISVKQGGVMTNRDCARLFYNLMTARTSGGQVYGAALGYTVTNGKVDYTALILEDLSGPYVASGGDLALSFQPTTVYRNGKVSSSATLKRYDVYYYHEGTGTLWIYTDRVAGKISALSPSSAAPASVTVSGITYSIGSAAATYQLSAMGGGSVGQMVTLLLGMDDAVVDVLTGSEVAAIYYGVVESSSRSVSGDGAAAVQTNVTVVCTDGATRTFTADQDKTYEAGQLVTVQVSNGGVSVSKLTEKQTSGTVDRGAAKLGDLSFAEDIEILDTSSVGTGVAVEASQLSGLSLSRDDIRYYGLDAQGKIEYLILDDVTGELWTYAYLTGVEDQSQNTSVSVSYTYLIDGAEQTLRASTTKYPVETGGIAILYGAGGSVKMMQSLTSAKLTQLASGWAMASNQKIAVAEDVQVYLRKDGNYYLITLSAVNAEDYTLTGWYSRGGNSDGGQIRLVIAVERDG